MIPKQLRDLIKQAEMDKVAEEFWKEVEREKIAREFWEEIDRLAQKYEVTSDYILQEFYIGDKY
jgi:hypothetical protein